MTGGMAVLYEGGKVSGSAKGGRLDSSRNVTMFAICSPTIPRTNKPKSRYTPASACHRYNPKAGLALACVGCRRHFPGTVKTVVRKNVAIATLPWNQPGVGGMVNQASSLRSAT